MPRNGQSLSEVVLLAPLLYPGALFCAGANYWDHLNEMAEIAKRTTGRDAFDDQGDRSRGSSSRPRPARSSATTRRRRLPNFSRQVDWEAEIGVVIGRPTRNISEDKALDAVAGYLIVNDLSARDLMKREGSIFIYDWIGQKCFEDGAPMGPWLTPAAYVSDPNNLAIKLWVNGVAQAGFQHRQDGAQHRRADRLSQPTRHAAAGRCHRDRHAGRRRHAARRIPQSRRRSED